MGCFALVRNNSVHPRRAGLDEKGDIVVTRIASPRACIAVDLLPFYEEAARERQGARTDILALVPECWGNSRDFAAEKDHVNPHYVTGGGMGNRIESGDIHPPREKRRDIDRLTYAWKRLYFSLRA